MNLRGSHAGVFAALWLLARMLCAQEAAIERLDPRLDTLLPADAKVEKIAEGFRWLEGPVWDRQTQSLLFSDIPANTIYQWREGSSPTLYLRPSGYSGTQDFAGREPGSNGLTFDSGGRLVICQHGDRRIARLNEDGTLTPLADRYRGQRLNSPNDAVFRSNGDLYFTDPPFGLPGTFADSAKELPHQGVYRLQPDGTVTLLVKDLKAPNGIAFSPDERRLYVTDVDAAHPAWWVYAVQPDGTLANGRVFADARPWTLRYPGGPDGLKTDRHGNVFASGPGGVYVFADDGTLLGRIDLGVATSNVNWGEDGGTLFITASTAVYRIRLATRGR